jgi:6-phosphogluconolactonase (cycloisomerase 2 family)
MPPDFAGPPFWRKPIRLDRYLPTQTGRVSSGGSIPRYIGFDPSGRFLIAANQDTGELITFRVDAATGALDHRNGM